MESDAASPVATSSDSIRLVGIPAPIKTAMQWNNPEYWSGEPGEPGELGGTRRTAAKMLSRKAFNLFLRRSIHARGGRPAAVSLARPKPKRACDIEEWFNYRKVIVSGVPSSFATGSVRFEEPLDPIDLEKARRQHAAYVSELRKLVPEVVVMEPDTRYPDMVFVEDPAVVLLDKAIINKIGHPTREGESAKMQETLEEMGIETHHLQKIDPRATLDGGDVLFTGREFLVGLSRRTNKVSASGSSACFLCGP